MLEKLEVTLVGVSPVLMHNGRLSDPLDPHTKALKELTSKKGKTDEAILEIRKVEWMGGLYQDVDGTIGFPSDCVLAVLLEGARKSKKGKQAAAGVFEAEPFFPLVYEGPRDPIKLYETPGFCDYRPVRVQRNRVMRARPRFDTWKLPVRLLVNTDVMDVDDVAEALRMAGMLSGIGDHRPRYGRFEVVMP